MAPLFMKTLGLAALAGLGIGVFSRDDGKPRQSTSSQRELNEKQKYFASLTDEDWKQRLDPTQYRILRKSGTEPSRTGPYWRKDAEAPPDSIYRCVGCGSPLFREDSKFLSFSGWPSFTRPLNGAVVEEIEQSWLGRRTEVRCSTCDGHLGHVFEDGPANDGGLRYCINGYALLRERSEASEGSKSVVPAPDSNVS